MEANECTKKKISAWKIASIVIFSLYAVMVFWYASCGELLYNEVDSNTIATASLQYRFSTIIEEGDFETAKEDFPDLYEKVYSMDELRASGLVSVGEGKYIPFYFPAYPATCIPAKLVLQGLELDQSRAFSLTNAALICISLLLVIFALKTDDRIRFFVLLLLMASPSFLYVNYVNYEAYMVAFVTMSIVFYANKRRNLAALFLGIAALANQAVLVVGASYVLFSFAEAIYGYVKERKTSEFKISGVIKKFLNAVLYVCCFLPGLIPIAWRTVVAGGDMYLNNVIESFAGLFGNEEGIHLASSSISAGMLTEYSGVTVNVSFSWLERLWAYITDINLGVASFAVLQVIIAIALIVYLIIKRKFLSLIFAASFILSLAGVSIAMAHICSGMVYCSRYVVWSYPFLAAFIGLNIGELRRIRLQITMSVILAAVSCGMIAVNVLNWDAHAYASYNYISAKILNTFPGFYNPIKCVFLSRTNGVDGGSCYDYSDIEPTYYVDTSDIYTVQYYNVRKILFRADENGVADVKNELVGDDESMKWLSNVLDSYGLDGEYHYLNISKSSPYQFRKATPEETGQLIQGKKKVDLSDIVLKENKDNATVGDSNFNYAHCYEYAEPITIRSNTYYKVEISVPKELRTDGLLSIDFFAEGYDNDEQESKEFAKKDVEEYVFYWYTGDLGTDKIYGYLRCMYYTDKADIKPTINYLKCYKMKENNG